MDHGLDQSSASVLLMMAQRCAMGGEGGGGGLTNDLMWNRKEREIKDFSLN